MSQLFLNVAGAKAGFSRLKNQIQMAARLKNPSGGLPLAKAQMDVFGRLRLEPVLQEAVELDRLDRLDRDSGKDKGEDEDAGGFGTVDGNGRARFGTGDGNGRAMEICLRVDFLPPPREAKTDETETEIGLKLELDPP